jgi:hypothetical protein
MPAEDQNREARANREDTARERSFDALAKGLAHGSVSRRQALKLLGNA